MSVLAAMILTASIPKLSFQLIPYALIPKPAVSVWLGGSYVLRSNTIVAGSAGTELAVRAINERLRKNFGTQSRTKTDAPASKIFIKIDPLMPELGKEGYTLDVDAESIRISAPKANGAYYGVQTLLQLMPLDRVAGNAVSIPMTSIVDRPRFSWRGLHLDCSRHFFTVAEIEKYIDYMAMMKLNTFHWHLIDEGGWRMEVKKYPKLTQVGAWRRKTPEVWGGKLEFPGKESGADLYGGFYTQDQIRHIVKYAKQHMIEVIPEIEMPGHILPAIWAYHELGCNVKGQPPGAGFPTYAFCVGKSSTHDFIQNVLKETMALFPSKIIHIGGDEVNQGQWLNCPDCSGYMLDKGIKDGKELQSDFLKRTEKFLNAYGRTLMGWDEILDGGLAPKAMVMSWRGTQGGIDAAHAGHEVVMSPTSHCYFDYPYSSTPTKEVFNFDPVPWELKDHAEDLIIGGQANVWTEWIPDFKRVEYMIFPRILAMSEALWAPREGKVWEEFQMRLNAWYPKLMKMGANFYVAPPSAPYSLITLDRSASIAFEATPVPGIQLRYQIDDGPWEPYVKPVTVDKPCTVTAAAYRAGKTSDESAKVSVIDGPMPSAPATAPGLNRSVYGGTFVKVPNADSKLHTAFSSGPSQSFDVAEFKAEKSFALRFTGWLEIPTTGEYVLSIGSDDGSQLFLNGRLAVDNDRLQAFTERGGRMKLKAGWYPVEIRYFDGGGGRALKMWLEGPGQPRHELQPSDFRLP